MTQLDAWVAELQDLQETRRRYQQLQRNHELQRSDIAIAEQRLKTAHEENRDLKQQIKTLQDMLTNLQTCNSDDGERVIELENALKDIKYAWERSAFARTITEVFTEVEAIFNNIVLTNDD